MSAVSTLRSRGPVTWRMDFMRSCVIGRGSSIPSSARAIALASSRPIQIGTTLPVSGSRRTTTGAFVTGSTVTPATVTSLGMGRPLFPDEGVGPRAGHEDGPDRPFGAHGGEVHRLVASGSTAKHPRVPRAPSCDETRDLPTDLRRKAFPGMGRLKLLQAPQPRGRLLRVDLLLHLRRPGSGAGREAERERGVEPDLPHDGESLPKIVLRLPREADGEVGRARHARAGSPQRFDLREVLPACVAPSHGRENTVGAGLQRTGDVGAERPDPLAAPDPPG